MYVKDQVLFDRSRQIAQPFHRYHHTEWPKSCNNKTLAWFLVWVGQLSYLFFAVSTALIIIAPFVPGSFTYSNLGGGACGGNWEDVITASLPSGPPGRG